MPKPIVAIAWAAAAALLVGCPSLSALECQGSACGGDAGAGAGTDEAGAGGALGIACGEGSCVAPKEECCIPLHDSPTCVAALQCNGGTDIFCDDSAQCGGAPCWLCNAGGLQGTSCDYEDDIVQAWHCTEAKNVYQLCHSSSECDAGSSCMPLPIALPLSNQADGGVPAGGPVFYGCQP